jgi:hypothetical protein
MIDKKTGIIVEKMIDQESIDDHPKEENSQDMRNDNDID